MGNDQTSLGEQAYRLFKEIPSGLMLTETLLLKVTNGVNARLKAQGLPTISRLSSSSDLKTLTKPAAEAAIAFIPTLKQVSMPPLSVIAKLL